MVRYLLIILLFGTQAQAQLSRQYLQRPTSYTPPITCTVPGSSSDPDAQAWINATQMCSTTNIGAVTNFVTSAKSAGLWSKFIAVYPSVSDGVLQTRQNQIKWNLKDPRDLDAAYRLTFSGAMVFYGDSAFQTAGTEYADTHIIPATAWADDKTSAHFIAYVGTNDGVGSQGIAGAYQSEAQDWRVAGTGPYFLDSYNGTTGRLLNSAIPLGSPGILQFTKTTGYAALWNNGVATMSTTSPTLGTTSAPTISIQLGGYNQSGSNFHSTVRFGLVIFAQGLTQAETSTLYNIINTYKTAMGH